ncbi:MAG: AbrB/MazE/SpoVT family DNA-binding domain-containing protein [Firmicutes bacterium]|nr:AbrB/MazE/SpoVT family DNA-binding domain-containing protein [Bacillota bacterium]
MAEYIAEIDQYGNVNLPLGIREKLEVQEGDNLIFRAKEGKIEVEKFPLNIYENEDILTLVE